ncbi:MAG: DJ-1/PfpI family protein, partial [Succinivibrio sp.]
IRAIEQEAPTSTGRGGCHVKDFQEIIMTKAIIIYTNGTEDVEATATYDILVRGGVEVLRIAATPDDELLVKMGYGNVIKCDEHLNSFSSDFDLIVIPGGPGTSSLKNYPKIFELLKAHREKNGLIGAICAAPGVILYANGILKDPSKAACFPGCECGGSFSSEGVCYNEQENIVTGKSLYYTIPFALKLVSILQGDKAEATVREKIIAPKGKLY